ncbi:MAG: nucleotidyltransferase family protein [Acutalibacteraceae bacterium]
MTEQESVFIKLLSEYLFGQPITEFTEKCDVELFRLSALQNMLGICWAALKSHGGHDELLESCKRAVIAQTILQARKTEVFLQFYKELEANGISAVCVKGITLRSLYPEPDLRPSSDEDLIITEKEMKPFHAVCESCGFKIKTENENQITVYDEKSGLIIEAQKLFFLPGDRISEKMNGFFTESREHLFETGIQNVKIKTLSYTDNLLYLICHVLKHYIRSGFGIRQICDILLFCKAYHDKIDFNYISDKLSSISADGFAADIFKIGREYFGLDSILPESFVSREVDFEKLLRDVFSAGVFGKSTVARTHSAALTLEAVSGTDSIGKSAAKRAFVSFDELKESYPKLKGKKYLYPYYSLKRLADYFKKPKSVEVTKESMKIAGERLSQLNGYGLISASARKDYDEAVIKAICKRLESGKTAELTVTGSSMTPFLVPERDKVELGIIKSEPLVGDVVLYRRKNGAYVLHRVVKRDKKGLYFAGDSQTFIEGPIEKQQLIAVCVSFYRKGKKISGKEAAWKAFDFMWRKNIGLRPALLKAYAKIRK